MLDGVPSSTFLSLFFQRRITIHRESQFFGFGFRIMFIYFCLNPGIRNLLDLD